MRDSLLIAPYDESALYRILRRFWDYFPSCLNDQALETSAELNKSVLVALNGCISEAGPSSEFLGLAVSFRTDGEDVIASLALSEREIQKLVELASVLAERRAVALATLRKLAGNLPFTQRATMGRLGRAALKPVYEPIATGRGAVTREVRDCLRRWPPALPTMAPRLILSLSNKEPAGPVRMYSDATGAGELARISFFSKEEGRRPYLPATQADDDLEELATTSNKIPIFDLFATIATVFQRRGRVWGRRVNLFVDNEAACAAAATGVSRSKAALMLVFSLWAIAAQYDSALWTERVPTQVNPADIPSR